MKNTLLIDGTNIAFRHFLGRYYNNKNNVLKSTLFTSISFIKKMVSEIKPDYIISCWDNRGKKTFRSALDPSYKAHRPKAPEGLTEYIKAFQELLECLGIKCITAEEGFECDDAIGTLSVRASLAGQRVLIASSDKDFFQLCAHDNVYIYWVGKGGATLVDNKYIIDNYGVHAKQLIDVKTLMGDKSDNIPGVSGVGEKTALSLIKQHKSLKNLILYSYEAPNEHIHSKILADIDNIPLYRELSKIKTDIKINEMNVLPTSKTQINMKKFIQVCEANGADNLLGNIAQWSDIYEYTR